MSQELKCPLDEFEILLFTARNGKKVSIVIESANAMTKFIVWLDRH